MNKLVYSNNVVSISDSYMFRYPNEDQVFRFTGWNTDYDILESIGTYVGTVQIKTEDDVLATQYDISAIGVNIDSRNGGYWEVEVLLASPNKERLDDLSATIDSLMFDVIPSLMGGL